MAENKSGKKSSSSSKKLTKSEKICELECDLKIAAEENRRLRKRLMETQGDSSKCASSRAFGGESIASARDFDIDRMKDVMKAMRRVSVSQEHTIHALRTKASQRRVQLEQSDTVVNFLRKEIKKLQWVEQELEHIGQGSDPRHALCALQKAFLDERNKNEELYDLLDESEGELGRLREVVEFSPTPSRRESGSVGSWSSSQSDYDLSRMKEELARKSNTINDLTHELEMIKEELYEERQSKKTVQFSPSCHSRSNSFSTVSETSDEYSEKRKGGDQRKQNKGARDRRRHTVLNDSFEIDIAEVNDYIENDDNEFDSGSW